MYTTREGDDVHDPESPSAQLQHRAHSVGFTACPRRARTRCQAGHSAALPTPSPGAEHGPGCSHLLPPNHFATATRNTEGNKSKSKQRANMEDHSRKGHGI